MNPQPPEAADADPTADAALERALILATQAGLPLTPRPFETLAEQLGSDADTVRACFTAMQARGAIRRIGALPDHYALGYVANGMTVWDIDDAQLHDCGRRLGALGFVSHCYHRPRSLPAWPYNLFAMVHAHDRAEVEARRAEMRALLGSACRADAVLYSTRILKKTGLRIGA